MALRKKDDRSRFRPWLTGRFGKILKMEGTPGVFMLVVPLISRHVIEMKPPPPRTLLIAKGRS